MHFVFYFSLLMKDIKIFPTKAVFRSMFLAKNKSILRIKKIPVIELIYLSVFCSSKASLNYLEWVDGTLSFPHFYAINH